MGDIRRREFEDQLNDDQPFFFIDCSRGSILSTSIFVYAASAPVNGYFGGGLYSRMGGKAELVASRHTH